MKNYAAPDQSSSVDEIGPDNPRAVEIVGPVVQNQDRQGVVTRGMRKFGLPDIHLGQVMTGMSPFWLVSAVANTLAGGRMPDPETVRFEIRAGELGAKVETLGKDMAQPMIAVRLTPARELSSPTGNTILAIGFYGTPSLSLFERQVLVSDAFFGTRYHGLPAEDARAFRSPSRGQGPSSLRSNKARPG